MTNLYEHWFEKGLEIDSDLVKFMAAPMQLDSCNFRPDLEDNKWIKKDKEIFAKLLEHSEELKQNAEKHWKTLYDAKTDIEANLKLGLE